MRRVPDWGRVESSDLVIHKVIRTGCHTIFGRRGSLCFGEPSSYFSWRV